MVIRQLTELELPPQSRLTPPLQFVVAVDLLNDTKAPYLHKAQDEHYFIHSTISLIFNQDFTIHFDISALTRNMIRVQC